jgi:hypothetical protein
MALAHLQQALAHAQGPDLLSATLRYLELAPLDCPRWVACAALTQQLGGRDEAAGIWEAALKAAPHHLPLWL